MPRWRHYVRKGEGQVDQRDLQVNGNARVSEDFDGAGAPFFEPGASYTGFAADGRWRELGQEVAGSLTEGLGTDESPTNTCKWTLDGTADWAQDAVGLVVTVPEANGSTQSFSMLANRWQLRGDFLIRLHVDQCTITDGSATSANFDNAVWLETRWLSGGAAVRIKRYRGKSPGNDGVAAEVLLNDVVMQPFLGAVETPGLTKFVLVLQRHEQMLSAAVYDTDGNLIHEIMAPTLFPGIQTISVGARGTGGQAWGFRAKRFEHLTGWHDYSNVASWARERFTGTVTDDFWGDALDPTVWTSAWTGAATVAVIPGVDDAPGEGLKLYAPGTGSEATVHTPAITGDFDLTVDWWFPDTCVGGAAAEDVLLRLDVESTQARPALFCDAVLDDKGVITMRVGWWDADGQRHIALDEPVEMAQGRNVYRFRVTRSGMRFTWAVQSPAGISIVEANNGGLAPIHFPSVPMRTRMRTWAATSEGILTAHVARYHLSTPNALTLDAWPTRHYVATTKATENEVEGTALEPACTLSEGTVIDVLTRRAVWRAVGGGNGADPDDPFSGSPDPGLQALPQGEIQDPFFDARAGRLWLPVRSPEDEFGRWICFDLRLDIVRSKNPGGHFYWGEAPTSYPRAGLARIARRQFGLGHGTLSEFFDDDFSRAGLPPAGDPIKYLRFTLDNGDDWHVWATTTAGVRIQRTAANVTDAAVLLMPFEDPEFGIPCVVKRIAVVPGDSTHPSQLAATAAIFGDLALVTYRDMDALLSGLWQHYGAEGCSVVYTDTVIANGWFTTGGGWTRRGMLLTHGNDTAGTAFGGDDLDAMVSPSHATDRRMLIAVAQTFGVTIIQEPDLNDENTPFRFQWYSRKGSDIENVPEILTGEPRSVRLTRDSDLEASPPRGFLCVQETDNVVQVIGGGGGNNIQQATFSRLDVVSLARGTLRYSLVPFQMAPEEFEIGASAEGRAVRIIENPPDVAAGVRIVVGYDLPNGAVLEWDLWSLQPGGARGPHIGGTTIDLAGWGLETTAEVRVGGVDCFRLKKLAPLGPDALPHLSAVNRALAWIEHPEAQSPVMSDEELEATAEWPHTLEIVGNDGAILAVPDGFIYESNLCIERTLRRLLGRLPTEAMLDTDPKANKLQRHMLVAFAWLICRFREHFQAKIARDTYRAEALGDGLRAYAAGVSSAPPLAGMDDDAVRAYVLARAFGSRVTVAAVRETLKPILGYKPVITENYREFIVNVDPAEAPELQVNNSFWGEEGAADPLESAFMDRDFWHGEMAEVEAARATLEFIRAAGVAARVRLEPAP